MRPGRIFLFLLAVVLTLSFLTLVVDRIRKNHTLIQPVPDSIVTDTVAAPVTFHSEDSAAGHELYPGELIKDSLASGRQVRILFYGDSQIEGDRITSYLRQLMRSEGGGSGPGLISPLMPVMYTRSYIVRSSSNWTRYTLLDYRSDRLSNNSLGPLLSLCRFTIPGQSPGEPVQAWIRVTPVPGADEAVSRYDRLRIFYGNNKGTTRIKVTSGDATIAEGVLPEGEDLLEYSAPLPSLSDITISLSAVTSPDVYAISLESDTGIIIDNVPVRGSAGLEFVMTDSAGYRQVLKQLAPDLIVLQYGLNVVRNVRSEYHYYEEGLVRQIEYLKKNSGGTPLILVSLTDMAEKTGDTIASFKNIPAIRDAQRRAAERTGTIFWDAWETMGGTGSIIRWREHTPALASSDLTHLSNAGADTIAARLFSDLFAARPDEILSYDTSSVMIPGASQVMEAEESRREGLLSGIRYNPSQSFIFTTPAFWLFFLVVMAGFALIRKRRAMCHTWLLLVSVYFYYKAGGLYVILLLFTCLTAYLTAMLTGQSRSKPVRRFWLTVDIVILLGLLSYYKYAGFFTDTINSLLGTSFRSYDFISAWANSMFGSSFDISGIILPVGISFFTFQALSYNIDVYRGRIDHVRSFIDFSFYLTYFPQLVAGPIVRAAEFIPQMRGEYSISRNEFGHALFMILQGLIKKMVISDFISAGFIDRVFEAPGLFSGFENILAVYGYGLQIYCDFSGYTDIAIGVALLMGFKLPLNFNSPYKASNISDFWKRWHITLSRWLKDYLYIPLGGNRKGTVRTGINLMITMLLGGLWHGAATRFVLWGGLHGAGLALNKIWQRMTGRYTRHRLTARIAGTIITFNFVSFAWIFFRSPSMNDAGLMLTQIFSAFRPGDYSDVFFAYMPVVILIFSGYIIHFLPVTVKEAYRGLFIRLPLTVKFIVVIAVCLLLQKVGSGVLQPFIYFRF